MSLNEAQAAWFAARQELALIIREVQAKRDELDLKLARARDREERAFRALEVELVREPPPGFRPVEVDDAQT